MKNKKKNISLKATQTTKEIVSNLMNQLCSVIVCLQVLRTIKKSEKIKHTKYTERDKILYSNFKFQQIDQLFWIKEMATRVFMSTNCVLPEQNL
ncbi:hypothetical protein BLOT_005998 [Blomia tropicalis]|nr:hypothetical protein BLOT_005998 [Blomia tropicalis]